MAGMIGSIGMLLQNFIVPLVMILVGNMLRKHPVSDMRSHNGYNTPVSRRSQAHWDYAQKIAPEICIRLGKYLLAAEAVLNVVLLLARVSVGWALGIGGGIGIAALIGGFYYTDLKIMAYMRGEDAS